MINEYLHFLDFISPDITLYFNGKRSHSSTATISLSIIIILLILTISIYYSIDFIYKINPSSYFYKIFEEDIGIFPVNEIVDNNNLSTIIYHFLSFDDRKIDKRAFEIIGINSPANIILNKDISEYDHWIYDSCEKGIEDIQSFYNYLNEYQSVYLNHGLCISQYYNSELKTVYNKNDLNFKYPTVAHGNTNKNEIIYLIAIKKCENNTILNNNSCYDNETIENLIKEYQYYSIYFMDHHIDIENYNNPIKYFFHSVTRPVHFEDYSSNYLYFELTTINSYDGIFIYKKKSIDSFIYYTFEGSRNVRDGNCKKLIGIFIILFNNSRNIYVRKYKLLTDVMVIIAGINKFIIFFMKIFYIIPYYFTIFDDLKFIVKKKYKKYFNENNKNLINLNSFQSQILKKNRRFSLHNNFINKTKINNNINENYKTVINNKKDKKFNFCFEMNNNNYNNSINNFSKLNKTKSLLNTNNNESTLFSENNVDKNMKEFILIQKLCNFKNKDKNLLFYFFCFNQKKNSIFFQASKFRKNFLSEEELFLLHISIKKIKIILKKIKMLNLY